MDRGVPRDARGSRRGCGLRGPGLCRVSRRGGRAATRVAARVATRVATEHLPPYDVEPWVGLEEGTLAFHINPVGVECEEDISFRVLGEAYEQGALFDVWAVHETQGILELLGGASVDADGAISSDAGLPLRALTTLLLIEAQP